MNELFESFESIYFSQQLLLEDCTIIDPNHLIIIKRKLAISLLRVPLSRITVPLFCPVYISRLSVPFYGPITHIHA